MKSKSFIYIVFILIGFFTACTPSEDDMVTPNSSLPTEEICIDPDENMTLVNRNDGVDYILTCNLRMSANIILTIEPGVVIEVENGRRIEIKGQSAIRAIGTAAEPIVFRGNNNGGHSSWKGVLSETSNPNNVFDHVIIEDGGTEDYCCGKAANLFVDEGMVSITNCTFRNSGDIGLFLNDRLNYSSTVLAFENNQFENNDQFGVLVGLEILSDISEALSTCIFTNNGQQFVGVNADVFASDFLSEETHRWFSAPIPYLFVDEVRVLGSSRLVIEEGVDMVFAPGVYMVIGDGNGTDIPSISINGTSENPVIMRGETPIAGAWHGIRIKTDNASNQINHLHISHADDENYAAAITIRNFGTNPVTLSMDHVHIQEANCGIYVGTENADVTFTNITYSEVVSEICE